LSEEINEDGIQINQIDHYKYDSAFKAGFVNRESELLNNE